MVASHLPPANLIYALKNSHLKIIEEKTRKC
jgi:hypothetical protein